jgi:signal transduction histidine kinase
MPNGGTIRIGLQSHYPNVELTIADSGDGIPKENVSRLFDPFFTTKPIGEGTGLGLTVAHGIIQEHDGSITVESEPGKGAAFHIFLPIYNLPNI